MPADSAGRVAPLHWRPAIQHRVEVAATAGPKVVVQPAPQGVNPTPPLRSQTGSPRPARRDPASAATTSSGPVPQGDRLNCRTMCRRGRDPGAGSPAPNRARAPATKLQRARQALPGADSARAASPPKKAARRTTATSSMAAAPPAARCTTCTPSPRRISPPLPSYARVTNLSTNGKSVVVRVNDRGPFHSQPHHRPQLCRRGEARLPRARHRRVEVRALTPASCRTPRWRRSRAGDTSAMDALVDGLPRAVARSRTRRSAPRAAAPATSARQYPLRHAPGRQSADGRR